MRDPIPRGPFDQGLFLTHFNKGRDFYEARRFEEAERELEEAYLLRPRDTRVLNLLGLVYFKQDKFEKAEEVYQKLVAESPEAHTLYYNLGLIYFKLSRLEDSESAFLKALELTRDNPKINFYLGSIYERLRRFTDAIFQYRQAGASLMVRRVEDKMAAEPGAGAPAPVQAPGGSDTAEFRRAEIEASIRQQEAAVLGGGELLEPTNPPLPTGLLGRTSPSDTARFRRDQTKPREQTKPPDDGAKGPDPVPDTIPPGMLRAASPPRQRPRPPEAFRILQNNLMEIAFSGKVFIKQGTIYSYSGNFTFAVKEKRPGGQAALVIIIGTGKLILTDKDREITFMQVEAERVYVEPGHLLACEEGLSPHYVSLPGSAVDFIALEGRGMVALSVASKPLTIAVAPGLPVSVPASSVVTWSGELAPKPVEDKQVYEALLAATAGARSLIRFEGSGRILVEQSPR